MPHPIVVDARKGPWSIQALVFPLSSLFGEEQKNWQLLMVFGDAEICWGHSKGQDKCVQSKNIPSLS